MSKVSLATLSLLLVFGLTLSALPSQAQNADFHNAPASAKATKNPLAGKDPAAGGPSYQQLCASCHGDKGQGSGNIPALKKDRLAAVSSGELFWFITKGDLSNGMPAWGQLPETQRWQIVNYVKALGSPQLANAAPKSSDSSAGARVDAPPPPPPFTDFRYEKPGTVRKITLKDLPAPFQTKSAGNGPKVVARPPNAWPQVPAGFRVDLYADGLDNPRLIRRAPNGDLFVAQTGADSIKIFRGINSKGKPELISEYATGLKEPFGIAFYPPGPNPQWVYIGNINSVVRIPYQNGDLKARTQPQHIADLPGGGGHTTRDVQFSVDGKKMWVSVGSASNVDDPDTTPAEKLRADILEFNPDGSGMRIYAYGIRNAVGLAVDQKTGELWCSVNERDGLGDNLVPDYITHVQDGGFYGWPWWYMGGHQDPRHTGKRPELKDKVITPDVILHPHNASLQLTFYDGKQFPAEYHDDIFAAEHGSWNRSVRVGYELIHIPRHQSGRASGEYEDFMTGFVIDNTRVWGRPVGVATASDGSLMVTDDGSNSIWRITYVGGGK